MGGRTGFAWVVALIIGLMVGALGIAPAQQGGMSPYGTSSLVRRGSFGSAVPGSLGRPVTESAGILLTPQMFQGLLPPIPNLQAGYLYDFGMGLRASRFTLDYLLPIRLGPHSAVFGQAHAQWVGLTNKSSGSADHRTDLAFGGGFRRFVTDYALVGVNGFYDTTRLFNRWRGSTGLGVEFAALLPGNDALDLNVNWYGGLFSGTVISDVFRGGRFNFDVEVGYSHELGDLGPDLRLKFTGYKFDAGNAVYGWNAGAELKTRDGVFSVKYEVGDDRINRRYHTVGAFVNIGFSPERLVKGESPFSMPEPVFKSPRNIQSFLTQNVRRNWQGGRPVVVPSWAGGPGELFRFLPGVPMPWDGWRWSTGGCIAFDTPVRYQDLQPGKRMEITIEFEFNTTPGFTIWLAEVWGPVCWNGPTAMGTLIPSTAVDKGTVTFFLTDVGGQDPFIAAMTDVYSVIIQADNGDIFNPVVITSVTVRFNQ